MRSGSRAERAANEGLTTPPRLRLRGGWTVVSSAMAPHGSLLGNAVPRVEDPDILFGRASYVDDLDIPGVLHLVFVRSTVAHAELRAVDTAEAAGMPGVAGVFSSA